MQRVRIPRYLFSCLINDQPIKLFVPKTTFKLYCDKDNFSQIIIKVLGVTPEGGVAEKGTRSLSAKHGIKSHLRRSTQTFPK